MTGNSITVRRVVGNVAVTITIAHESDIDTSGRPLPPVSFRNPDWSKLTGSVNESADMLERAVIADAR